MYLYFVYVICCFVLHSQFLVVVTWFELVNLFNEVICIWKD